jgi:hypothetical protein
MAAYLRTFWHNDHPGEPVELLYEVQPDRRVTRLIEVFKDGSAIADTLEWSARRNPNIVNNICLCDGAFPSSEDMNARLAPPEFDWREIDFATFTALFARAQPRT